MSNISVTSEIGQLEEVIVHRPGLEVELMSPDAAQEALFDDTISYPRAKQEHKQLTAALSQFAQVYEVQELLAETLANATARTELVQQLCTGYRCEHLAAGLLDLPSEQLAHQLLVGVPQQPITLAAFLENAPYALPPMYNFYFMRDASMCVNERVIIGAMANHTRWGESLAMKAIFTYHPRWAGSPIAFDGTARQDKAVTVEGGDVTVLREDLLIIGQGERTSVAGIDQLLEKFAATDQIRHVIVQPIPSRRAYIHFDMVFTMIDRDLCVVHEPVVQGDYKLPPILFELHPTRSPRITRHPDLLTLLADLGLPLTAIPTGGHVPLYQAREQWQKGTNFFALAPGKIIGYARNERTYETLETHGFQVVAGSDLLAGKIDLTQPGRIAVAMTGAELSRGGGGCRCMTLPIRRKNAL